MVKKHFLIVLLIIVSVCLSISVCDVADKKLEGEWHGSGINLWSRSTGPNRLWVEKIRFDPDGSFEAINTVKGTYLVEGKTLTINVEYFNSRYIFPLIHVSNTDEWILVDYYMSEDYFQHLIDRINDSLMEGDPLFVPTDDNKENRDNSRSLTYNQFLAPKKFTWEIKKSNLQLTWHRVGEVNQQRVYTKVYTE
jgi:hypothetical protein